MSIDMTMWGWDERWESTLRGLAADRPATGVSAVGPAEGRLVPGRVIADNRGLFQVASGPGVAWSRPTGRLWDRIADTPEVPVTGDWVLVDPDERADKWPLHAVLPRRSALSRQAPTDERHAAREQVLAANVDLLLMVFGLDGGRNFTERGLERLATIAWQSGAVPVVVLNKADLAEDREGAELRAREAAPGAEVIVTSTVTDGGLDALASILQPGRTAALTGRSGVGKSTIINRLAGQDLLATQASREDDLRGRHTTSSRQMIRLASGALLIDTPGLRTLGLWAGGDALDDSFSDIAALAEGCRFGDCSHRGEPGCAVQQALSEGALDAGRYESYLSLQRELRFLNSRQDIRAQLEQKARNRAMARRIREHYRASGKRG
ncbi:MAG: ribosome small subunit-dependent GTPase A [Spirochaetes bacterium]|nr:ribosome small subunit-dependent GTPase A [Spirochaetota bacterium]